MGWGERFRFHILYLERTSHGKAGVDTESWLKGRRTTFNQVANDATTIQTRKMFANSKPKGFTWIWSSTPFLTGHMAGKKLLAPLPRAVNAVYASSSLLAVKILQIAWFQPLRHLSWTKEIFFIPFNIYFDFYSSRAPRRERRQARKKKKKWTSALMINKQVVCRQHKRFIISIRPRVKGCINVRFGWRSEREGPREPWSGCKASEPLQRHDYTFITISDGWRGVASGWKGRKVPCFQKIYVKCSLTSSLSFNIEKWNFQSTACITEQACTRKKYVFDNFVDKSV